LAPAFFLDSCAMVISRLLYVMSWRP
jgi:hypothetical protein